MSPSAALKPEVPHRHEPDTTRSQGKRRQGRGPTDPTKGHVLNTTSYWVRCVLKGGLRIHFVVKGNIFTGETFRVTQRKDLGETEWTGFGENERWPVRNRTCGKGEDGGRRLNPEGPKGYERTTTFILPVLNVYPWRVVNPWVCSCLPVLGQKGSPMAPSTVLGYYIPSTVWQSNQDSVLTVLYPTLVIYLWRRDVTNHRTTGFRVGVRHDRTPWHQLDHHMEQEYLHEGDKETEEKKRRMRTSRS